MRPDVTALLAAAPDNEDAAEKLFAVVYDDLRRIAGAQMRGERADHTLQATALVGEAYLRLCGPDQLNFNDRKHFYRVAAEAMRRILIDHARARLADKRGGGRARQDLPDDAAAAAELAPERLLDLDDALQTLAEEDARAAELVRLRFFGSLTVDEAAELLEISKRTAIRDWNFARARLSELMGDADDAAAP
jgi:RNA polymerase sigma factor (TIGR02999 family)